MVARHSIVARSRRAVEAKATMAEAAETGTATGTRTGTGTGPVQTPAVLRSMAAHSMRMPLRRQALLRLPVKAGTKAANRSCRRRGPVVVTSDTAPQLLKIAAGTKESLVMDHSEDVPLTTAAGTKAESPPGSSWPLHRSILMAVMLVGRQGLL